PGGNVELARELRDRRRRPLAQPPEQPRLSRRELETRARDQLPVDADTRVAADDRARDPLELALGAVVARRGEALADAFRPRGLAQRDLPEQPCQQERKRGNPGGREEDGVKGSREGGDVRRVDRGRQ